MELTDLVANRNLLGNGEDAVLKGFPKDGYFFSDFVHNFSLSQVNYTYTISRFSL